MKTSDPAVVTVAHSVDFSFTQLITSSYTILVLLTLNSHIQQHRASRLLFLFADTLTHQVPTGLRNTWWYGSVEIPKGSLSK